MWFVVMDSPIGPSNEKKNATNHDHHKSKKTNPPQRTPQLRLFPRATTKMNHTLPERYSKCHANALPSDQKPPITWCQWLRSTSQLGGRTLAGKRLLWKDMDDVDVDDDDDKFPALGRNSTSSFSADGSHCGSRHSKRPPCTATRDGQHVGESTVPSQSVGANQGYILGLQKGPSGQILEYNEAMDDDHMDDDNDEGNNNGSDYDEMLLQRMEHGQNIE